ncbi:MAG: hypothetical protein KDA32_09735 [Phycisphaerales bacterium]|nr:hypothetical protein [Phycisphaerales bacterium]
MRRCVSIALALIMGSCVVIAEQPQLSGAFFWIQATSSIGTGTWAIWVDPNDLDPCAPMVEYDLMSPIPLSTSGGTLVATLINCNMYVQQSSGGPQITVNFGVAAANANTTFTARTATLNLPHTIRAADAFIRYSGTVTVTDANGNGANALGTGAIGTGICRAFAPATQRISDLVAFVAVSGGGTVSGNQNDPQFGFRALGHDYKSLKNEMSFILTAGDVCFVSSDFGAMQVDVCVGDFNDNGVIDQADLTMQLITLGSCEGDANYHDILDFDADGCLMLQDLSGLLSAFGTSCP